MSQQSGRLWRISRIILMLAVLVVCLIVYWKTAYRTIPWWVGCYYSIAAITHGIAPPPGSLISTILGWLITQLPLGISKIFSLNLFTGVQAALVALIVILISLRIIRRFVLSENIERKESVMLFASLGVIAAGLNLAFGQTMWKYALQFTPYMLTALFTAILIWAMLRWLEKAEKRASTGWLFLIMLLFGLDFSVHRTNLLLLPGFFILVLLGNYRVLGRIRTWLVGFAGLLLGLAFHFLTIPISAGNPALNFNNPSNFSRFYDYISLKQFGGGWLVQFLPRKAPFFAIQLSDYLHFFTVNFFSRGTALTILVLLLALIGFLVLLKKVWRLSLGLLVLFLCSSLGAVIYFNLPKDFFWPMDRHYLPSYVIFSIFAACGAGSIFLFLFSYLKKFRIIAIPLIVLIVFSLPFKQLSRNYGVVDSSRNYFAYDYAQNILQNVGQDAIVIVAGDNFWTLFYLQTAEKVRPDVVVLSPSLMNTSWYMKQTLSRYPDFPITLTQEELSQLGPVPWRDTTVAVPFADKPDSVHIRVQPTVADRYLIPQDFLIVKLLVQNQWRRPIYCTYPPPYLFPLARPEGLVTQIVPTDSVRMDFSVLSKNLFSKYSFRGWADPSVPIDWFSQMTVQQLFSSFLDLAQIELMQGNSTACKQIKLELVKKLPPERIHPPEELLQRYENLCDPSNRK
ncbi:MAG TPA: DUF2723 domain-containing protein [Terriglobales bacterium]|nr:DUF2723 domain-containing protein [Terriglobales bacterium]